MKRKIAIVTGSRAEYGLLYWIIKGIQEDPDLALQLCVTGMHLSKKHSMTVCRIEEDGFSIAARIPILEEGDTGRATAISMGNALRGFADRYERLNPDVVVVLGDRFEIFAAAAAAVPFRIPIAHIHGGELTEGAIDECFRHAITKMSHLHFTSTEVYRSRVIKMGELPDRVFMVGAPGLDSVMRLALLDRHALAEDLDVPEEYQWGIVTYHPATLDDEVSQRQHIEALLRALSAFPQIYWLIGLPNADPGNRVIRATMEAYALTHTDHVRITGSLGTLRYFSLMKHAAVMVGNSSSGIIEAPSFKLPVINIGNRQQGRIRVQNVIDVPEDQEAIRVAIDKALSPEFKGSLRDLINPHGDGQASARIIKVLKTHPLGPDLIQKRFYDTV